MADTTVPVSDTVWEELNDRKGRGETYDEVLREVLGLDKAAHAAHGGSGETNDD